MCRGGAETEGERKNSKQTALSAQSPMAGGGGLIAEPPRYPKNDYFFYQLRRAP